MKNKWFTRWIAKPLANLPWFPTVIAVDAARMQACCFISFGPSQTIRDEINNRAIKAEKPYSSTAVIIETKEMCKSLIHQSVNMKT